MEDQTISFYTKYVNIGHLYVPVVGPVIFSDNGFAMDIERQLDPFGHVFNLRIGLKDVVSCHYHVRNDRPTNVKIIWLEVNAEFAKMVKHYIWDLINSQIRPKFEFDPKGIYREDMAANFIVLCFDDDDNFDLSTLDEFTEQYRKIVTNIGGSSEHKLFSLSKEDVSTMLENLGNNTRPLGELIQNTDPNLAGFQVKNFSSQVNGEEVKHGGVNNEKQQPAPLTTTANAYEHTINTTGNNPPGIIGPHDIQRNISLPPFPNPTTAGNNSLSIQNLQYHQMMTNCQNVPFRHPPAHPSNQPHIPNLGPHPVRTPTAENNREMLANYNSITPLNAHPMNFPRQILGNGQPVPPGPGTAPGPPGPLAMNRSHPFHNSGNIYASGFPRVFLSASCIAIGIYKWIPIGEVEVSTKSIKIWFHSHFNFSMMPELNGGIEIPIQEVVKVLASFSDFPEAALFIYISPLFAAHLWEVFKRHPKLQEFKDLNEVMNSMNLIMIKLPKVPRERVEIAYEILCRLVVLPGVHGSLLDFIDLRKANHYLAAGNFYSKGNR